MFLVKLIVGALCVITCVKIAKSKAESLKITSNFWQALIDFCNAMVIDLSYKKSTLKELFSKDYNCNDFNNFLKKYEYSGDFEFPSYVLEDEKMLISSFFSYLGKSDSEAQKQYLLAKQTEFVSILHKKMKYQNKFYSVILTVGFSVGLMLFVMVI